MAERRLHVSPSLAEGPEILISRQHLRRLVHLREVERIVQLTRVGLSERIFLCMNIIVVRASRRRETCMQLRTDLFHLLHRDVVRQQAVQLIGQLSPVDTLLRLETRFRIEVGHHHPGVYPRIRSAGTRHAHSLPQQRRQRLLKPCLHRVAVGLYLPPVIPCPVVTESDKIPLHRIYYSESGCKNNKKIRLFKEKKVKMTQIRKNALPLQRRWRSPPL